MTVSPDWTIPRQTSNTKFDDLDHIRDDQHISLVAGILGAGGLVIGWDMLQTFRSPNSLSYWHSYQDQGTGYLLKITHVYSGVRPINRTYEVDYGRGDGWQDFIPDRVIYVYDGAGRLSHHYWIES